MEEERMQKMPEKWPLTVAARKYFVVLEKPSESLFFIPE